MPEEIGVSVNGKPIAVPEGVSVASAILMADSYCRRSVTGEYRGPLCGIGICFECRAQVNGTPHRRTCQLACAPGMEIFSE
jgi:hypothetical protein